MMDVAVRADGVGKLYQIGEREQYLALRDMPARAAAALGQRFLGGKQRQKNGSDEGGREVWALRDLSFHIRSGEVVGIIGKNGAGKSTLLKVLSRITEPTEGIIEIRGRVGSLLEVGTGFHPELTGRENVWLNGAILGMRRREIAERFDEIVDFSGVDRFIDTPVKHYSSGMQMRLAFAVAAHLGSEILLIDEILAVGDADFQRKSFGRMEEISREGRTVILVSHSLSSVARLCERAIVLDAGRLVFDGPASEAVATYLTSSARSEYRVPYSGQRPEIVLATAEWLSAGELVVRAAFQSPRPLCPPVLGIVVADRAGRPVFGTNPRIDPQEESPSPMDSGLITVRIPTSSFRPGAYIVSLWLGDWHQDYSCAEHALRVDIGLTDESSSGQPPEVIGSLRVSCDWTYAPLSALSATEAIAGG